MAIEQLVRDRIELPAFSALDRLGRRIRTLVNGRYFTLIDTRLTADEKQRLDDLLVVTDARIKSPLQAIKRLPKRSSLQHFRALVLLGFWRGFRGDELTRLQVQDLRLVPGEGMTCFLPHSKGDRQHVGTTYKVPALSRWCPVVATSAWVSAAALTDGPVFRAIERWGGIAESSLHPNSLVRLLRRTFDQAGLASPNDYSGHSLRRGFAGWANANGWDLKTLMEYVGWRDVHSAMRYIDGADPFARERIEASLAPSQAPLLSLPAPGGI